MAPQPPSSPSPGDVSRSRDVDNTAAPAAPDDHAVDEGILRTMLRYPVIVLCCVYANIGIFMYGFDNITLSLCLSMPPFVQNFGAPSADDGQLAIPAHWQSLWNAMPQVTTGLGAWFSGALADRLGRRAAFAAAAALSAAGVAVVYTADGGGPGGPGAGASASASARSGAFLAGKMANGLGLGLALSTGQTYISEIAPLRLRGVALSAYTFSQNLGFLVAASISLKRTAIPDASAYKVVFAAEWVWPGLLLLALPLVPESPYHLARKGRPDAARRAVAALHSRKQPPPESSLDFITSTVFAEEYGGPGPGSSGDGAAAAQGAGESTFADCFRRDNWRRTRVVLYANGLPQMIGTVFITNAPYFMTTAGLSPESTAMMTELGIGLAIISSVAMFLAMAFAVGRRVLVLGGIAFAALLFFVMGVASSLPVQNSATLWCTGVTLQMVWLSVGPAIGPAMAVAGEVSAPRLRAKTMALGFLFNYSYSTVWNIAVPYMFNRDQGDLGGRMGWVFLATCLLSLAVIWLELPDTMGLSFTDIDERFARRVPAWRFGEPLPDAGAGGGRKAMELGEVEQAEYA